MYVITEGRLLDLLKSESTLQSLENAGVDNWEGDADYDHDLLDLEHLHEGYEEKDVFPLEVWTLDSKYDIGIRGVYLSESLLREDINVKLADMSNLNSHMSEDFLLEIVNSLDLGINSINGVLDD